MTNRKPNQSQNQNAPPKREGLEWGTVNQSWFNRYCPRIGSQGRMPYACCSERSLFVAGLEEGPWAGFHVGEDRFLPIEFGMLVEEVAGIEIVTAGMTAARIEAH